MINAILSIVLFEIFSFRNNNDSSGTNTYPKDSNIGKSLRFTPWLIAVMLMKREMNEIPYAVITLQLSIDLNQDLYSLSALFLSNS